MVKTELEYNPYLLETTIRFNGQKPRINSLVEKYESGALRNWIDKIPEIFYDEMNGYDFELVFTGTDRDFDELKKVFKKNGVGEDKVHLFHKNKLAGRKEKIEKLEEMRKWLSENSNSHFDYDAFRDINKELFEGLYPYIIINGHGLDVSSFDNTDVSLELIDNVNELEHTALDDTPILLHISINNQTKMASIITTLIERDDVTVNQLFFSVDNKLSVPQVERTIIDIGIYHPQIISSVDDKQVLRYLELYPFSDYIHDALHVLRSEVDEITLTLDEENRVKSEENKEVYEKLEELEDVINRLKRTQEIFEADYNSEIPQIWKEKTDLFLKEVEEWKIKKTIIKKKDEAYKYASEFETDVKKSYEKFLQEMELVYDQQIEEINGEYESWYAVAEYDDFKPLVEVIDPLQFEDIPSFYMKLLEMKQEQYVDAKEGILGMIFKDSNDEEKEKVLETTFYLQDWRNYVIKLVYPLAWNVLNEYFSKKRAYEKYVLDSYVSHLSEEINKKNEERIMVSSQLSDDEKRLQCDNDWLREFDERLRVIERC